MQWPPRGGTVAHTWLRLSHSRTPGGPHLYAAIRSATLTGTLGTPLVVEAHVGNGVPGFTVVGLPDEGCRESRDRVRAAMLSCGLEWPNRRITINLVGAGERRGGAGLDLAIAVGILVATGQIEQQWVEPFAFVAELGLDGSLRPAPGMAPLVACIGDRPIVVGDSALVESALARPDALKPVRSLAELMAVLRAEIAWPDIDVPVVEVVRDTVPDLSDVRGQSLARVALEVAAAGAHHMLMIGPPGAGKSMLAKRLPGILPRLDPESAFEVAMVRSAAGLAVDGCVATSPPFRAPHHSISVNGMVGGGTNGIRPGELSLASRGVLFLDEMGEFAPTVLDSLRQPVEDGVVRVSRTNASVTMPARCLLVAATNPCPCGNGSRHGCGCAPAAKQRYLRRFSGPILDRFDIRVALLPPTASELTSMQKGESSAAVAERVGRARELALSRQGCLNSAIGADVLDEVAPLTDGAMEVLRHRLESGALTGRGYHRVRRVARSIADVRGDDGPLSVASVEAALMLRVRIDIGEVDPR